MYRFLLTVLFLFVSPFLSASDLGTSTNVGQPGFYGQINLGNHYPSPRLIYPDPVVAMPQTVPVPQQPIYLHVPPGHAKKWGKHCHRYNACHSPAYFVQQDWYNDVYVPQYANQHRHPDASPDSYRRLDDSGHTDDDRRKQSRRNMQRGDHDQFDDGEDDQRGRGKGKRRDRDDDGGQNKRDHERGNRRD
jgi:hypothetical protein